MLKTTEKTKDVILFALNFLLLNFDDAMEGLDTDLTEDDLQRIITDIEKPKLHVSARRWFSKPYGNTYHSVKVYLDDNLVGFVPFEYGYDSQYLQTAFDVLKKHGHVPHDVDYGYWYMRDNFQFTESVMDVNRKRDLNF